MRGCLQRGVGVGDPVMSVGPPSGGPTFVGPLSGGPSLVPSSRFSLIGSIEPVMPDCVDDNATAPKSGWFLSFGPPTGGPIVVGAPRGRSTTIGPPSGEPLLVTLSRFSSVGPLSSVTMSLVPSSRFSSVSSVSPPSGAPTSVGPPSGEPSLVPSSRVVMVWGCMGQPGCLRQGG